MKTHALINSVDVILQYLRPTAAFSFSADPRVKNDIFHVTKFIYIKL